MKQKNIVRRIIMILAFYAINFGLWEVLVLFISNEWASFGVYVVLFPVTLLLLGKQLKKEWQVFTTSLKTNKYFLVELILALIAYVLLNGIVVGIASACGLNMLPQNNENISTQLQSIPVFLTFIQTCIFAPVIEETTFRYSIIGQVEKENKLMLVILSIIAIVMFDAIHIFTFDEFFFYLAPAIVLTGFYIRRKSVMASIILHSTLNVIGTLLLMVQ